jgi:hypothetical protein
LMPVMPVARAEDLAAPAAREIHDHRESIPAL